MKALRLFVPFLLLALLLCACGSPAAPAQPVEAATPEPLATPEPTPEIPSTITLKNDGLPEGYQLTDYTLARNSTAYTETYIDTGVFPTNQTGFWVDFECVEGYHNVESWFFGCFEREAELFMEVGYHLGQNNEAHFYTATGTQYSQLEDPSARTVAWLHPEDYFYPNVTLGMTFYDFTEPVSRSFYLFSRDNGDRNGMAGDVEYLGDYALRVYGCKIWDEQEPVRDYLPCVRLSDGTAGMYDLVEGRFCSSDGDGQFEAGPALLSETRVPAVNGMVTETLPVAERPGFVFRGWYTEPEGAGLCCIDAQGQPCGDAGTEDRTLYAFWERDEAWFDQY